VVVAALLGTSLTVSHSCNLYYRRSVSPTNFEYQNKAEYRMTMVSVVDVGGVVGMCYTARAPRHVHSGGTRGEVHCCYPQPLILIMPVDPGTGRLSVLTSPIGQRPRSNPIRPPPQCMFRLSMFAVQWGCFDGEVWRPRIPWSLLIKCMYQNGQWRYLCVRGYQESAWR
jgi:hypothetical protein